MLWNKGKEKIAFTNYWRLKQPVLFFCKQKKLYLIKFSYLQANLIQQLRLSLYSSSKFFSLLPTFSVEQDYSEICIRLFPYWSENWTEYRTEYYLI